MKIAQGWQVMLADLSLILFICTAAALEASEAPAAIADPPGEEHGGETSAAPIGEASVPVALYRHHGGDGFRHWLATRHTDSRERLTIIARHADKGRETAMASADRLAAEAASLGFAPRIVVEPGDRAETLAMFDFANDPQLVRRLHD